MRRLVCDMDVQFQHSFVRNERALWRLRRQVSEVRNALDSSDVTEAEYSRLLSRLIRLCRVCKARDYRQRCLMLRLRG